MITRLCRTFQTTPAGIPKDNTAKYLESAFTVTGFQVPDWLVPDIEEFAAAEAECTGAVTIDGQMIDEAILKNYNNTVDTVVAIRGTSDQQASTASTTTGLSAR